MNLHDYDIIILNSSAGKDSLVMLWGMSRLAKKQNYPIDKIVVSHQDLGKVEWFGTKELVKKQADLFGFKTYYSKRRNKDGYEETLLEYALRRGKWPSNNQRWCTSDFKRGPGQRIITMLTKGLGACKVLNCFGFRREESPARSKKPFLEINKSCTTKKRTVYNCCPILDWIEKKVWKVIKLFKLPYHFAYDLGMPRLSCCFCFYSPFDALVIAGYVNYKLLCDYIEVENKIGHAFTMLFFLSEVKEAIDRGYKPKRISNWIM